LIIFLVFLYILFNHNTSTSNTGTEIDTFDNAKSDTKDIPHEIVLYYAMWCGYSKMFLPEWEKFVAYAGKNIKNVKVTSIRCEGGDEVTCKQKGVDGYPMVILYLNDGSEIPFQVNSADERTSDNLVKFVNNHI